MGVKYEYNVDEAQLVRDGTVQAAQLASKLRATHRFVS